MQNAPTAAKKQGLWHYKVKIIIFKMVKNSIVLCFYEAIFFLFWCEIQQHYFVIISHNLKCTTKEADWNKTQFF